MDTEMETDIDVEDEIELDPAVVREMKHDRRYWEWHMQGLPEEQIARMTASTVERVRLGVSREEERSGLKAQRNRGRRNSGNVLWDVIKNIDDIMKEGCRDEIKVELAKTKLSAVQSYTKLYGLNAPRRTESKTMTMRIDADSVLSHKESANGELQAWRADLAQRRTSMTPGLPPPASTPDISSTTAASSTTRKDSERPAPE